MRVTDDACAKPREVSARGRPGAGRGQRFSHETELRGPVGGYCQWRNEGGGAHVEAALLAVGCGHATRPDTTHLPIAFPRVVSQIDQAIHAGVIGGTVPSGGMIPVTAG